VAADYANVLVPVDGSDLAESALGPARGLAERFGAALHTVTGAVHRDERWWCEEYLDRLRAGAAGVETHLSTDRRGPDAIVAMARELDPCLVCMATHGRARSAALLGSTFAQVAASSEGPVLAVGPRFSPDLDAPRPGRLVACLDGKPEAEQTLPLVAGWARRFDARVTLLTAADPLVVRSWSGPVETWKAKDYLPSGDPDEYLAVLAGLPLFDGLVVDRSVLWGLAEPSLMVSERFEWHRATIAAAVTHARTGLARAALGSTVARIVHHSRVPVLVAPVVPVS
jgi:nucleotide-binding universal stress UspA family protein